MAELQTRLTFSDVSRAAADHWPAILEGLGIDGALLRRQHGPCPGCGGRDRFRFDNKDGRGTFVCGRGGDVPLAGDGFELLRHVHGWSRPEALQQVARWLRLDHRPSQAPITPAPALRATQQEAETRRNRARMLRLWSESRPLQAGDPVTRYLAARGLALPVPPAALRCHSALPYWHQVDGKPRVLGRFPAMMAIITDPEGRWVGLHRTYLNNEARKADVCDPETGESLPVKKMLSTAPGVCTGAAVRLADPSPDGLLVVAEGIETALAASHLSGRPAWACLSAHGMESLQLHHPVCDVLIAADNDANEAGQSAARALARRLLTAGRVVRMKWPDAPGTDWLDVLNSQGGQP